MVGLPYVVMKPGPITNTLGKLAGKQLITVSGAQTYPTQGALDFTTVRISGGPGYRSPCGTCWRRRSSPARTSSTRSCTSPRAMTDKQVEEESTAEMIDSQQEAIAVALKALGQKVVEHVVIGQVAKDAPSAAAAQGRRRDRDRGRQGRRRLRRRARHRRRAQAGGVRGARLGRATASRITVAAKTRDAEGRATVGVFLGIRFEFPFDVKINAGNVGGPSAGTMFSLAIYDTLTPGPLTGGQQIAGTGTIDSTGRSARSAASGRSSSAPTTAARSGSWLRPTTATRSSATSRRPAGGQDRDLRRGQDRGRGHRRQARRLAAHLHEVRACAPRSAQLRVPRAGSALQRRLERVDEARGDLVAERDLVVAVVGALAQQAAALTVAGHGDEQPDVLAARVGGQRVDRDSVCAGRSRSASGGHDDALDGQGGTRRRCRARRSRRAGSRGWRSGQVLLLDRAQRALGQVGAAHLGAQVRLALEQLGRGHEREQPRVLVPPGRGDVALGVEGGDGQRVGDGLGVLAHAPMVPHPARWPVTRHTQGLHRWCQDVSKGRVGTTGAVGKLDPLQQAASAGGRTADRAWREFF